MAKPIQRLPEFLSGHSSQLYGEAAFGGSVEGADEGNGVARLVSRDRRGTIAADRIHEILNLSPVPIVVSMAFFEGFIQRFMPYLAELAARQGSAEMEYTDVHGVCDVTHTQELFRALEAEMALESPMPEQEMYEGVDLLRALIQNIIVDNDAANN